MTGGDAVTKVFSTLDEAKKWLVGETAKGIEMPSTPISIPGVMDLAKAEGVGMFQATPERLREALANAQGPCCRQISQG